MKKLAQGRLSCSALNAAMQAKMDQSVALLRARRGSMALPSLRVISNVADALIRTRNRVVKERQTKALFTLLERPGQRWVWVEDSEQAFIPASVLEECKVPSRRGAEAVAWPRCSCVCYRHRREWAAVASVRRLRRAL